MPQFSWSGTNRNGASVSGELDATSKEAVVSALRAQNIVVTTVTEHGEIMETKSVGPRLGRFVLAVVLLGGATLMAMIAKGARIHCAQAGASYDCTVDTTMAGFRTMYSENIRSARNATVETRSAITGNKRGGGRAATSRLMIISDAQPLSTEWMQNPFPASEYAARQLNDTFAKRAASVDTWQIEAAPAAVAIVLALVGAWLLIRAAAA